MYAGAYLYSKKTAPRFGILSQQDSSNQIHNSAFEFRPPITLLVSEICLKRCWATRCEIERSNSLTDDLEIRISGLDIAALNYPPRSRYREHRQGSLRDLRSMIRADRFSK
jgi:hypothetical protein